MSLLGPPAAISLSSESLWHVIPALFTFLCSSLCESHLPIWAVGFVMLSQWASCPARDAQAVERESGSDQLTITVTIIFLMFIYLPGCGCGMWTLVPWPGIEPRRLAVAEWSLRHWATRKVPAFISCCLLSLWLKMGYASWVKICLQLLVISALW